MATAHLKGSARISYDPSDGGSTITHLLAVPLSPVREIRPARKRARYDWWAWNETDREVVTVGPGVQEVTATIRLDNEPDALMDMLQDALENDLTLTYQVDESATGVPLRLVEVVGSEGDEVGIIGDRGRYGGGEWEVAVRLRRTDGGSLAVIFTDEGS
jgi:hypothetical protein